MGKKGRKNKPSKLKEGKQETSTKKKEGKQYASKKKNGGKRKSKRKHGKNEETVNCLEDQQFRQSVEEGGLRTIIEMSADGNCLFRSISDQLYNDYGNMHDEIRHEVCDYIEANEEEFAVFLVLDETEEDEDAANFEEYCNSMREDGEWGGNVELVAAARLYRRNITVFSTAAAFTIEHGGKASTGPDMLLSFHDNDHYNSVRDSKRPQKLTPRQVSQKAKRNSLINGDKMDIGDSTGNENQTSNCSSSADESSSSSSISRKKSKIRAQKPSDHCACGSGLRYKKCCLAAEKRREKLQKWKEKNDQQEEAAKKKEEEETLDDGKLKVLSI